MLVPDIFNFATGEFVPVDKGIEVACRFILDGQYVQTGAWFQAPDVPTASDLEAAALVMSQWWGDISSNVSQMLIPLAFQAYDRTAQVRPSFILTSFTPANGAITGEIAPNSVAACVSFLTGFGHISGRGRSYLMGIGVSQLTNNQFEPAQRAAWLAAYEQIRLDAASAGLTHVIVSRYHDGLPRPLGVCVPVIACRIDPYVDSQRRRLPGRGR